MTREMKNSGIEWIGQIPADWNIIKSKYIFTNHKEIVGDREKDFERLSLTLNGVLKRPKDDSKGLQSESLSTYQILYEDELVFKMIDLENTSTSRVGYSPYTGLVSPVYIIFNNKEYSRYGYWYFYNLWQRNIYNTLGNNGVRSALNASDMLGLPFIQVPKEEMKKIADFLDSKVSEIDKMIAETKSSIENYKEYKQSVITEAVTKGLNKDVQMKDSGIEWIGQIPADWNIIKITRLLDEEHSYAIGDGDHGLVKTEDYTDTGIPYIRVQNLGWGTKLNFDGLVYISEETNERIKNSILKPNDVLFAKTGGTIGKTAIIPEDIPVANTTSHVGKITVSKKYNPKWVFYVLSSSVGYRQFWEIASQKTTRPELSIEEIKTLKLPVPRKKEEQDNIVKFIENKCIEIDRLISEKEALVSNLEEYKKSLIYEYVTGKKSVL